jgi:hypothetical protein
MAPSASAELICFPTDEGESCVVIGDPVPPDPPAPPPPPDQCLIDPQSCDPCAFGACDPSMMAQGDPPKGPPSASPPSTPRFGGVTTANFGKKVDELKKLVEKVNELAKPKDSKKDTLNGLLIARAFVAGIPIAFLPKFGGQDAMLIRFDRFAMADPNDSLAKLLLQALDCKKADSSCADAQVKEFDERRAEIAKLQADIQTLTDNLSGCNNSGQCKPSKDQVDRFSGEIAAFNTGKVPELLTLSDEAQRLGGRLDKLNGLEKFPIECELNSDSLSFNSCLNPLESKTAREAAERAREEEEREKKKAPSGI